MNESRSKFLWNSTIKHVIQFPSCTLCEHSFGSVQYEWVVGRSYLQVHWGTPAQHCSPSIPGSWGQSQSGDLLAVDSLRGSLSHGAHHHCYCAPCGDHGVLRCALCGELPLLEIEAGGHFLATQGQLPPSKGRLACPWSCWFVRIKQANNPWSLPSSCTRSQRHGALARVGAELSLCEVCGWIGTCDPLLPAPRCSFPCQLAPQCFWASLHFGHFGQTQTPFLGFHKCPKTNSLSFRPAGHPEAEEGGVSKRLERVLWLLWLIAKGSQGPWGTRGDTARHPTSRRSLMEMSVLQIFSGVVSTNFVAEMLEIF